MVAPSYAPLRDPSAAQDRSRLSIQTLAVAGASKEGFLSREALGAHARTHAVYNLIEGVVRGSSAARRGH